MGRPKLNIDEKEVEKLAALHCTNEEIASWFSCSADTIENRFSGVIKRGKEKAKTSLKRKQYEIAMSGNVSMLIWLGKNLLGQKDKPETLADCTTDELIREVGIRLSGFDSAQTASQARDQSNPKRIGSSQSLLS